MEMCSDRAPASSSSPSGSIAASSSMSIMAAKNVKARTLGAKGKRVGALGRLWLKVNYHI